MVPIKSVRSPPLFGLVGSNCLTKEMCMDRQSGNTKSHSRSVAESLTLNLSQHPKMAAFESIHFG